MAGTLTIDTLKDGLGNSTSSTNCIQGSAKAWVNYKGTATRAINSSYNVSSVTFNSTGNYTVNFTNALVDANFSVVVSASDATYSYAAGSIATTSSTTRVVSQIYTGSGTDVPFISVAVFR